MAIQTLNTIKNWFKTGLKPSQQQFWDTWDSFRHKFEKVSLKDIEGIDELLSSKADKSALNNHLADTNAHAPQVNTDWNSESGFSKLLNKPEFKTINGESIIGTSDINIAPTLQQVMDAGSTALIDGEAGILSNSDNGYSRFYLSGEMAELNNLDTDLKKAVSMSLKDGDLKITSQNTATGKYTRINLSEDPKVNTEISFPNKETAGNYILATLDDIAGANQDLQSVIENGGLYQNSDGSASIIIFPSIAPKNFGVSVYGDGRSSYTSFGLAENIMLFVNSTTNYQSSISIQEGKFEALQNTQEGGGKTTKLLFKDPIALSGGSDIGAKVYIPAPEQGEYTLPVRIKQGDDYYTASDNGDLEIPEMPNLSQVLAKGSRAKSLMTLQDPNGTDNYFFFSGDYAALADANMSKQTRIHQDHLFIYDDPNGGNMSLDVFGLKNNNFATGGNGSSSLNFLASRLGNSVLNVPNTGTTNVIPVEVNGVKADENGKITIPIGGDISGGGSQTIDQTIGFGNTATNKLIRFKSTIQPLYSSYISEREVAMLVDASSGNYGSVISSDQIYIRNKIESTGNFQPSGVAILKVEKGNYNTVDIARGVLELQTNGNNGSSAISKLLSPKGGFYSSYEFPINIEVPNEVITLPISVNGVKADEYGNIAVSFGGGSQDLKSVIENGGFAGFNSNNQVITIFDSNEGADTFAVNSQGDNRNGSINIDTKHATLSGNDINNNSLLGVKDGKIILEQSNKNLNVTTTLNFNVPTVNTVVSMPAKTISGNYTLATTDDIEASATAQTLQKTLENGSEAVTNKNIIIKSNNTDLGIDSAIYIAPNNLTDPNMVGLYIHTDASLGMRGVNGFSLSSESGSGWISASPLQDFTLNAQTKKLVLQGGTGSGGGVAIEGKGGNIDLVGTANYNGKEIATKDDLTSVNTAFLVKTYRNTLSVTYDRLNPNFEVHLTGNLDLNLVGTSNGSSGLVNLYFSANQTAILNGIKSLAITGAGEMIPVSFIHDSDGIKWYYNNLVTQTKLASQDGTILYHKLPFLQEGTISNTGTSITGVGTDFDVWDIGSKIVKANGETAIIASVTNGLSITTVEPFETNSSSSTYKVYHKAYELMEDGATNFYPYNRGVSPSIKITSDNIVKLHDQEFRPNGNVQGINEWKFGNTALYEDDIKLFRWGSLLSSAGTHEPTDIGFKRHEAGIWEINNGTPENYADLMLRKVVMTAADYSNDTEADADTTLPSGGLYTVNGDRTVRRKP